MTDAGTSTDGTVQCAGDCDNRATGVYEAPVPPAGSIRVNLCWDCAPNVTPVRYLHAGTDRDK